MTQGSRPASQPVHSGEFNELLEGCLNQHFGTRRPLVKVKRTYSAYSTSFTIEDVEVLFDDGKTLCIMFKDLSRHSLVGQAHLVKPEFLYDPLREIETYRTILPTAGLGTATLYGSVTDASRDRYWLFIEKVPGVELYQVGDFAVWLEVARWLAQMHRTISIDNDLVGKVSGLLQYDEEFYSRWMRRARHFVGDRLERLAQRYARVIERLTNMPQGFIHGEFYASNVLIAESAICSPQSSIRVCPIDWEMAAIGPALMDLAALSAGKWTGGERRDMVLAYADAIETWSGNAPSVKELLESIEYCRLHLCMQWLGWAPNWRRPVEHTHDWLEEALHLSENLTL